MIGKIWYRMKRMAAMAEGGVTIAVATFQVFLAWRSRII